MPAIKRSNTPNPAELKERFGYVKVIPIEHYMSPWLIVGVTQQGKLDIFTCTTVSPTFSLEPEQVQEILKALK